MKRFILLGGQDYYARGGFHDFISDHDTAEEAEQAARAWMNREEYSKRIEWWHVFDRELGIVCRADGFAYGAETDIPSLKPKSAT